MILDTYYVYVYIDPRNFEEFYYGKGKGNRKDAHLRDGSDSEKVQRIQAIQKAGLKPIIRVIAKGLSEDQALLIEKTLLWKLGKSLTNRSSGHFAKTFRPHNTLYRELQGFDFRNEIYYVNVGEGKHRNWDDCKKYGFMVAGGGERFTEPLRSLSIGDIVVAYLKGYGFVGIGKVVAEAVPVYEFTINDRPLIEFTLTEPGIFINENNKLVDYLVKVKWKKAVKRDQAKWIRNQGLYTTQHVKASLKGQPQTIKFLERSFGIKFSDFLKA